MNLLTNQPSLLKKTLVVRVAVEGHMSVSLIYPGRIRISSKVIP